MNLTEDRVFNFQNEFQESTYDFIYSFSIQNRKFGCIEQYTFNSGSYCTEMSTFAIFFHGFY